MSFFLDQINDQEDKLNMTPMIDIVFLLIIFFMLVTKINEDKLVLLTLPSATQAAPDDGARGRIIINIDKDGVVKIDNNTYKPSKLPEKIETEVTLADGSLENARQKNGSDLVVLVRADVDTQYYHLQEVIRALSAKHVFKLDIAVRDREKD
ncbi:ExbD/TolR family protein [Planctomycetota bacterium]